MIKRIYLDNYRCFSNFEFKPAQINLILGANGSGKTSLFDALSSLFDLVVLGESVSNVFTSHSLTRWDSRDLQSFEIDVETSGERFTYALQVSHDRDDDKKTLIVREVVRQDELTLFRYEDGEVHLHNNEGLERTSFSFKGRRSFLPEIEDRQETQKLKAFLSAFADTWTLKLSPERMSELSSTESAWLERDGSNFASWYRHLQQEDPEGITQLFQNLYEVLPGFRSLRLAKLSKFRELLAVFSSSPDKKYEISFDELSDGQRTLIVLYALLIGVLSGERTLMLDEPGNYVALTELQPWLGCLDEALGDNRQLFFISHHPEVIDFLAANNPVTFERIDGGPVRIKQTLFDRDSGLRASEQIARGLVNG